MHHASVSRIFAGDTRLTVSSVWELFAIEEPGASELNREACEAWKAAAILAYSQLV